MDPGIPPSFTSETEVDQVSKKFDDRRHMHCQGQQPKALLAPWNSSLSSGVLPQQSEKCISEDKDKRS
jgi:hypothetical protein